MTGPGWLSPDEVDRELSAMTAPTAHPARQVFGRTVVVHAVAAGRIDLPRLALGPGEPLCGTFSDLQPCPPGLFAEPVTCSRCLAVAEAVHVTIGEP